MTPPPSRAVAGFDAARLRLARNARGLTKQELAELLNVTPGAVSQYERPGSYSPTPEVLARAALGLGFPREFFSTGRPTFEAESSQAHFRSLRSTTQRERRQALTHIAFLAEVARAVEAHVLLPKVAIPLHPLDSDATPEQIEAVARQTREELGVEPGPVPNVVRTLEAAGVVVGRLRTDTERVNAFSVNGLGMRPMVILTSNKDDAARSRMDAAHELGHLVQHDEADVGSQVVERQANQFASAFLMPADEIRPYLPRRFNLDVLLDLKRTWGVSLAALLFRSRSLGVIAESTYRRAMVRISSERWPDGTTWRTREPGSIGQAEEPTMLRQAYEMANDMAGGHLDAQLALPSDVLDVILGS